MIWTIGECVSTNALQQNLQIRRADPQLFHTTVSTGEQGFTNLLPSQHYESTRLDGDAQRLYVE